MPDTVRGTLAKLVIDNTKVKLFTLTVAAPKGGKEVIAMVVPDTWRGRLLILTIAEVSPDTETIEPAPIETVAEVKPLTETIEPTAKSGRDVILIDEFKPKSGRDVMAIVVPET